MPEKDFKKRKKSNLKTPKTQQNGWFKVPNNKYMTLMKIMKTSETSTA
jgi:hypothetical protein